MRGFRPQPQQPGPDRTPAAARAYTELRTKILYGELPAGTPLSEADTATMLGLSRTPVREALRELLTDGLLEEAPRRQVVVATASPELNREVALMRGALERLAIREAAENFDDSDIDQLRLIMIRTRRALKAGDINSYLDCDDEFHLHIPHAAGLFLIEDALRRLRGFTRLAGLVTGWNLDDFERSADEHDAIIDSLATHNADDVEQILIDHLAATRTALAPDTH